jgi:hypothetical protein
LHITRFSCVLLPPSLPVSLFLSDRLTVAHWCSPLLTSKLSLQQLLVVMASLTAVWCLMPVESAEATTRAVLVFVISTGHRTHTTYTTHTHTHTRTHTYTHVHTQNTHTQVVMASLTAVWCLMPAESAEATARAVLVLLHVQQELLVLLLKLPVYYPFAHTPHTPNTLHPTYTTCATLQLLLYCPNHDR